MGQAVRLAAHWGATERRTLNRLDGCGAGVAVAAAGVTAGSKDGVEVGATGGAAVALANKPVGVGVDET